MKKAMVVSGNLNGFSIGEIVRVGESKEIDAINGGDYKKTDKVVMPTSLENTPTNQLQTIHFSDAVSYLSDGTTTYYDYADVPLIDDGSGNMIFDTSFVFYPALKAHWKIQLNQTEKTKDDISKLYETMRKEVFDQMFITFATKDASTALTYKETWSLMSSNPSGYTGLKSRFILTGFALNDSLDTDAKVKNYADLCLARVSTYGVYLMQRVQQFRNERDVLLGV